MNKNFTFYHFTILGTNKLAKNKSNKKEPLKNVYKKFSKSLKLFKILPSDELVNNILKHADL